MLFPSLFRSLCGQEGHSGFFQFRKAVYPAGYICPDTLPGSLQPGQKAPEADIQHFKSKNPALHVPKRFPAIQIRPDLFHTCRDLFRSKPFQFFFVFLFIGR